ncbi:MAG: adenylyl-sulfate kinase [Cytophagaceae bacterium]|nr:adenylyl-sulfate kinase [Cytophagaceae bacterium]
MENIHPIFDQVLARTSKEAMLHQKGIVLWFVGLSGSGKSTIAKALERDLHQAGKLTMLLDGDNLRTGINNNLGFSEADRKENIRRAAEVAKLFADNGTITICSLISPTEEIRNMAKEIIGKDYFEVFINCPLEICEQRDVKGLYQKARKGEIKNFTGIDSPFEHPLHASIEVRTDLTSLDDCKDNILRAVTPLITH